MSARHMRATAAARRNDQHKRMPSWTYQLDEAVQERKSADEGIYNFLARAQIERRAQVLFINPERDASFRDWHVDDQLTIRMDHLDECELIERNLRRTIDRIRRAGENPNEPPKPHQDDTYEDVTTEGAP